MQFFIGEVSTHTATQPEPELFDAYSHSGMCRVGVQTEVGSHVALSDQNVSATQIDCDLSKAEVLFGPSALVVEATSFALQKLLGKVHEQQRAIGKDYLLEEEDSGGFQGSEVSDSRGYVFEGVADDKRLILLPSRAARALNQEWWLRRCAVLCRMTVCLGVLPRGMEARFLARSMSRS